MQYVGELDRISFTVKEARLYLKMSVDQKKSYLMKERPPRVFEVRGRVYITRTNDYLVHNFYQTYFTLWLFAVLEISVNSAGILRKRVERYERIAAQGWRFRTYKCLRCL